MVETVTGTNRSNGISYTELLGLDSRPVPTFLSEESPMLPGPSEIPAWVYYSRTFHDLEVEKLWSRVWQLACHEDELQDVGDHVVYDIAHLSFLLVRTGTDPDDLRAYRNSCLHRGRKLREANGKCFPNLRCSFHGWCWNLDGSIKEIPSQWDFPHLDTQNLNLPEARLERYGGFVFINPDPSSEPLSDYLGDFPNHQTTLPLHRRYKAVHVAKVIECNWKVCQEAFMESYHVIATHPTLLESIGDANSRYDVYGNFSRAISPSEIPSPHLADVVDWEPDPDGRLYTRFRHPLSGHIYERIDEDLVRVLDEAGNESKFHSDGRWIEGDLTHADPHLCLWVGGKQLPDATEVPTPLTSRANLAERRTQLAERKRSEFRRLLGEQAEVVDVDAICDAEMIDSIFFSVFPNWHPWGCVNPIQYRFRPQGDNPDQCIFECMLFLPSPNGEDRPAPAPIHWLEADEDWTEAPQLGLLAKVFNQDFHNLNKVQQGLKNLASQRVRLADYQETKLRHFHELLQQHLELDYNEMLNGDQPGYLLR